MPLPPQLSLAMGLHLHDKKPSRTQNLAEASSRRESLGRKAKCSENRDRQLKKNMLESESQQNGMDNKSKSIDQSVKVKTETEAETTPASAAITTEESINTDLMQIVGDSVSVPASLQSDYEPKSKRRGRPKSSSTSEKKRKLLCGDCDETFRNDQERQEHLIDSGHKPPSRFQTRVVDESKGVFKCWAQGCEGVYTSTQGRSQHMKRVHPNIRRTQRKTPLDAPVKKFKSMADFVAWKTETEAGGQFLWRKRSCQKEIKPGRWYQQFMCNRSGSYQSKLAEHNRIRRLKTGGTIKDGQQCPAFLNVVYEEKSGQVTVKYGLTHAPHDYKMAYRQGPWEGFGNQKELRRQRASQHAFNHNLEPVWQAPCEPGTQHVVVDGEHEQDMLTLAHAQHNSVDNEHMRNGANGQIHRQVNSIAHSSRLGILQRGQLEMSKMLSPGNTCSLDVQTINSLITLQRNTMRRITELLHPHRAAPRIRRHYKSREEQQQLVLEQSLSSMVQQTEQEMYIYTEDTSDNNQSHSHNTSADVQMVYEDQPTMDDNMMLVYEHVDAAQPTAVMDEGHVNVPYTTIQHSKSKRTNQRKATNQSANEQQPVYVYDDNGAVFTLSSY